MQSEDVGDASQFAQDDRNQTSQVEPCCIDICKIAEMFWNRFFYNALTYLW